MSDFGHVRPATTPPSFRLRLPNTAFVASFVLPTCILIAPILGTVGVAIYALLTCYFCYLDRDRLIANPCVSILFVFLAFGLISTVWSEAKWATFYYGIQIVLTVLGGMLVASSARPFDSLVGISAAFIVHTIASHLFGHYVPWENGQVVFVGIDFAKNYYGGASGVTTILSFGLIFASLHRQNWKLVFVGIVGFLLGALGLYRSLAMGFTLSTFAAIALMTFLNGYRSLSDRLRLGLMTYTIYAVVCSSFVFYLIRDNIASLILKVTHKDATLTGRTEIWAVAGEAIKHKPLLGTGQSAFWVEGNPYAERIWTMAGIANKRGFSLHNSYLDLLATVGIVGTVVYVICLLSLFYIQCKILLRSTTTVQNCWFCLAIFFILLSGVENFAPSAINYYTFAFSIGLTFYWFNDRAPEFAPLVRKLYS